MAYQCLSLLVSISLLAKVNAFPQPQGTVASPADATFSSLIASATSAGLKQYTPPPGDTPITEWIALGDSYTAGIGANGDLDYEKSSGDCSRYEKAYPIQMNSNKIWPGDSTQRLVTNGACTGAEIKDFTENQLQDRPGKNYRSFGKPQLAILTISGNDLGFTRIINDCVYRVWAPGDCETSLRDTEAMIQDPGFLGQLHSAIITLALKGQMAGGATPAESFQVFLNGYTGFWNHDDPGCDTVNWVMWGGNSKFNLGRPFRRRMNDIVDQVNFMLKRTASILEPYGVIYVDGWQKDFDTHRFCEPGTNPKYPIGESTWFWHYWSPWNNKEGPDVAPGASIESSGTPLDQALANALIPDAGQRALVMSGQKSPWDYNQAFMSNEALLDALDKLADNGTSPDSWLSDSVRRVFHPKGSAYGAQAAVNIQAILNSRKTAAVAAPPPPPPPPPAPKPVDFCGSWYQVVDDQFEVYGKDFDWAKLGPNGEGLIHQIKHCGAVTHTHFTNLTNDVNGMQWKLVGLLPIGTKSCVGSMVVAFGGNQADSCTGPG